MFQNGSLIQLTEKSDKQYIVLENVKNDDKFSYLLAECNREKSGSKLIIDYNTVFTISVKKDVDGYSIEHDRKIIMELINKSMQKN